MVKKWRPGGCLHEEALRFIRRGVGFGRTRPRSEIQVGVGHMVWSRGSRGRVGTGWTNGAGGRVFGATRMGHLALRPMWADGHAIAHPRGRGCFALGIN